VTARIPERAVGEDPVTVGARPAIEVSHLHKTYGETVAVEDVSFSVAEGQIFGLLGPNGAGKTTTVECAVGLRRADSGQVRILGLDPARDRERLRFAGLMVLLVTGIAGFGLKTPQSVGGLALSVALTAVAVFGIGLWITGIAPNAAMAGGIAWVTFFPLAFFAGVFVPLPILPPVVRDIGDWTPLGAAVHALQDAMQTGFPPARFLLVLTGYALVSGALAIRFFRWE
jgi:hypothetical protein